MKNILQKTIFGAIILSTILPSFVFATNYTNSYCTNGGEMSIEKAFEAYSKGLIGIELLVNESSTSATFKVVNKTKCTIPVSLSSYKMFDTVLSHQEFFQGTGLVYATSSTAISVELPNCMAQIDAWYGLHPENLLDSNPYGYPNIPAVVAFKFTHNEGTGFADASGDFCTKEIPNTKPNITVTGLNPVELTVGNTYLDLGATALDAEDGDITSQIVTTSNVNTNATGTYSVKYNVLDSKGLSADEKIRVVNIVPATTTPVDTVFLSATKIVCKEESDLPNWGAGGPDISSTTVSSFLASRPNCSVVPWTFEWANKNTPNPGDSMTIGGVSWMPFGGTTTVPVSDKVWVREQFNQDYIPFSGLNTHKNISAEIYCDTDVLNYDNYDWILPTTKDKTYFCVAWNVLKTVTNPINTPPVITLIGTNPIDVFVGDAFIDPGATAHDAEDGNITSNIIASSTVNTNTVGSYVVTYNVKDSQGLSATEVSRTVNVLKKPVSIKGKITFCLLITDSENKLATSSYSLPSGIFKIDLGTTTSSIASSTIINSQNWNSSTFSPNSRAILNVNDAECVTYENLPNGIYTYSQVATPSSAWEKVVYNDQDTQPVNNVFDFYPYSDTDTNSDGYIVLDDYRYERTLYVLAKKNSAPLCELPVITSALTVSAVVNTAFSYILTASSTDSVSLSVSTTSLPAWLSFATTTNTISGTATTTGTHDISLKAVNTCGINEKTLVITVSPAGGGGGGGGPSSDINVSKTADKSTANVSDTITYKITVENKGPNDTTNVNLEDKLPLGLTFVSATSTVGAYATSTGIWTIGNLANNASSTLTIIVTINSGTEGQKISNTAVASSTLSDPTNGNNTSTFDLQVNPIPTSGGGSGGGGGGGGVPANGPISTFIPSNGPVVAPSNPTTPEINSCYYLYDYLRADFNNNPVEVRKLQVFLRDLEGFKDVQITGVYDAQTIVALDAFQERYKSDILTPWGHTAPTSYTYILTKKKVNEIYCRMAFPVSSSQQAEIDAYKAFLQGLKDAGIDLENIPTIIPGGSIKPNTPGTASFPQVGKATTTNKVGVLGTLASYSSTTADIISSLTANVVGAGKKIASTLSGYFVWPVKTVFNKTGQCVDTFLGMGWLNYMLILIILVLSYLWYREYKNNKYIDEINKEIDLQ